MARILTSFAHATFFGIASVVATRIVPPNRRASGVAVVFGGITVATILGVPLGTEIGERLGWNATFWMVAAIGATAVVAIAVWLPPKMSAERAHLRAELGVLRDRHVLVAMLVTALTWGSLFAVFTYITPILEEATGMSEQSVIAVLFAFGIGITVGNFVGGRLADWRLLPSIVGMTASVAAALVVFALVLRVPNLAVVVLVLWGFFVFALAPPLQVWVVSAAERAPHIASTINQAAFHIGAASGAWLGASALSAGVALGHLPWVSFVVTLVALAVAGTIAAIEPQRGKATAAESERSRASTA
jgi:DHA1 family inner membrane transport protein